TGFYRPYDRLPIAHACQLLAIFHDCFPTAQPRSAIAQQCIGPIPRDAKRANSPATKGREFSAAKSCKFPGGSNHRNCDREQMMTTQHEKFELSRIGHTSKRRILSVAKSALLYAPIAAIGI
mgnify:CR=1